MPAAVRAAVAVSTLTGALLLTAAPAAAARGGATHIRYSDLGTFATYSGPLGSVFNDAGVSVVETAPGTGLLRYDQEVFATDANGNATDMVGWAWGSGEVALQIDARLRSAVVSGTISVDRCTQIVDWSCVDEEIVDLSVEGTWTATTPILRSHVLSVISASRSSREVLSINSKYTFADARVSVGGDLIVVPSFPTAATISDATNSTIDVYMGGGNLPGTLLARPLTASAPTAGQALKGKTVDTSDVAGGSWGVPGTGFSASITGYSSTSRVNGQTQTSFMAFYADNLVGTDDYGNQILLQSTTGSGQSGSLVMSPALARGSLAATLDSQVCTAIDPWDQVCIDGGPLAIQATWTNDGQIDRSVEISTYQTLDGRRHEVHTLAVGADLAAATASVNGQTLGPSSAAYLEHTQIISDQPL